MNNRKYKWSLYIITTVIVATVCIQLYWNYTNYLANKQQLINDVQTSLDKAVDDYYADLAQRTTLGISLEGDAQENIFEEGGDFDKIIKQIDEVNKEFKNLDSLKISELKGISVYKGNSADSLMKDNFKKNNPVSLDTFKIEINNSPDSLKLKDFSMLTSKVFISIKNDTLDIKHVDSLLKTEFSRKNINLDYNLIYKNKKSSFKPDESIISSTRDSLKTNTVLTTISKSTFLPKNTVLSINFSNITKTILKRSSLGILISALLILAVIGCVFYLLRIIKNQKQLAEVKNDLISNITHEFKTPIATIGAALESINNFNVIEDKEKTKNYISMSSQQLSKLNTMVEKILETATLDNEHLNLNKEHFNFIDVLNNSIEKFKSFQHNKNIITNFSKQSFEVFLDIFHIENAINNIIDNAIKYGGNTITIHLNETEKFTILTISDNGGFLNKNHKDKIFEKFYRVPKGNTHDVKGFGIGLYYTKTIIEKHNGNIALELSEKLTSFKISLPNE